MFLAFVLGEFIAVQNWVWIFFIIFILLATIKIITKQQVTVFVVFFLFCVIGFLITEYEIKNRDIAYSMKEEQQIAIGQVSKIEESQIGFQIYLQNVILNNRNFNKIIVYADSVDELKIGNKVRVNGCIQQFSSARNQGNFDSKNYYMSLGIYVGISAIKIEKIDSDYDNVRENLRQLKISIDRNLDKVCNYKTKGLYKVLQDKNTIYKGILLGDKSDMNTEIKELYSIAGISHVLAISGLHISLIGMLIYTLLRKRFKFAVSFAPSMALVISFGLMSGMGIATIRAVVMFGLKLLGEVLGRSYDYLTAISTAGIMLMLYNPFVIYHSGFQMSFAAIIAITLVWPIVCNILGIETKTKLLLFGLNIGMILNPIIAFNYYQLPTYSFLLNIIVVPLMSVVIVSGMTGITLSFINIWMGRLGILPGCVILELYNYLCKVFSKLPFSNVIVGKPSIGIIIVYYVMLTVFLLGANYIRNQRNREERKKNEIIAKEGRKIESKKIRSIRLRKMNRRFRRLSLVIYVILNFLIYNPAKELFQEKNLEVTFLDVGQGDGIFVRTDNGTTITIDGGSTSVNQVGKYRIIPYMKAKGIKIIDYAIVTHTDIDHISGLEEMIIESDNQGVKVKNLVMPDIPLKDEAFLKFISLAREHKVNVLYISEGNELKLGSVEFACLNPSLSTKAKDRNDYSMVLSVTYNQFSMLLTGDISSEVEEKIMSTLQNHYTLLKVAHHGSKYSTSEAFLKKINPDYSMISVGEHNLYGHPSGETLSRLADIGTHTYRTDECGGIMVKINQYGNIVKLKGFLEESSQ